MPPPPLLSRSQIEDFVKAGATIGSHTRTHPHLTQLPPDKMKEELAGSKHALEDMLGRPVDVLCYPYGDYDDRVADAAREAGYTMALTTNRGKAMPGGDMFRVPRIMIGKGRNLFKFAQKIAHSFSNGKVGESS